MYDSMLHMQMQEAATQLNRGHEVNWAAMPLSGVFQTTDGAVCMVGALQGEPAARHLQGARARRGPLQPRPASRPSKASSSTSRSCRRSSGSASPTNTTAYWVDPARGAGPPLRAGAHPGGGARRRADAGQPHGRRDGAPARRHRAGAERADPALRHPERRPPHRRRCWASTTRRCCASSAIDDDARRPDPAGRGDPMTRPHAPSATRSARARGPRRLGDHRPAARAQRRRRGQHRASCNEIWDQIEARPERPRRRRHRRRRPGVLHRRRHVRRRGRQDRPGLLGRPGPERLRRPEPAPHPGRPGDRPGQRLRPRRRHGDRARRRHRGRRRTAHSSG